MLELIDNIYVFSNSRAHFGEIIAVRARSGIRKRNIFSEFGISEGERSFLLRAWFGDDKKLVAVVGKRDKTKVPILFIKGFCGVESLGLAIEPLECSPAMLRRYLFGFCGEAAISDEICEMVNAGFDSMIYGEPAIHDFVDTVREVKSLCGIAAFAETAMHDAVLTVSRLVGVKIELSRATDKHGNVGMSKPRFAGNEILAMLAIMALSARENADDRTLYVETGYLDNMTRIEAYFTTDKTDFEELRTNLSDIAEGIGMIHSEIKVEGVVRLRALPYVRDVSLLGLKASDEIAKARFYWS